ncbi:hypothetical protein [Saccharomonospora glauca]|uniref:Secreted protein n=1 Tax=Saccharomonospora glauca K62 TaxID=928724 RepID=I1D7J9_9PSEU|nr:hypothetical protein [Saccharomonospora glauca]EIF00924.1 hypothetical protein SacglDRAFT_04088 [Saccharomonospora glauca K62]
MRTVSVLALLLLAGCGSAPGAGTACTEIGAPAGVGVDTAPGLPAHAAEVEVCWEGECRSAEAVLNPATEPGDTGCAGTSPDDGCSARLTPTGGATGFVDVPELPDRPVELTLTITDGAGETLATDTLRVTPRRVYPNGSHCGAAGPQVRLDVSAEGRVSVG